MKRLAIICLSSLSLFGCAAIGESFNRMLPDYQRPPSPQERMKATLDSWIGRDANDLVGAIGYPNRTFAAPNGNTVYAYERSASSTVVLNSPSQTNVYGYGNSATATNWGSNSYAIPVTQSCNLYFEVNSSTQIARWMANGNTCY